ncbi:MAG: serine/threonine protein kinase, partial [Planctomycetota bacterium]
MEPEDLTGHEFSGYSIGPLLGKSASGITYNAARGGQAYAWKILPPQISAVEGGDLGPFFEELGAAANLDQENLVKIHAIEEVDGLKVVIQEFVDWPTLEEVLAQRGPLPHKEAGALLQQILRACRAAHGAGILHRDLHPAIIFVSPDGEVKVSGFGLSKDLLHGAGASLPGYFLERVEYYSPEK